MEQRLIRPKHFETLIHNLKLNVNFAVKFHVKNEFQLYDLKLLTITICKKKNVICMLIFFKCKILYRL